MPDLPVLVTLLRSLTQHLQSHIVLLHDPRGIRAAQMGLLAGWLAYLLGVGISFVVVCLSPVLMKLFCCLIAVLMGGSARHLHKILDCAENQRSQVEAIDQAIERCLRWLETLSQP
ncbi:MAG TPA: hypothetical protein IGS37_02300 [Synechococcales cyanobacterium M55_K2018_004]|nr:hypothetical protein [Synechococcales cyanobacterium M55_K2018_004]